MTQKERQYSIDEFLELFNQFQLDNPLDESSLSSDFIERIDNATQYFYTSEVKNGSQTSDDSAPNLQQTILISAYQLMNFYKNSLLQISKSFGLSYSPSGSEMISTICNDLQLDSRNEIISQIQQNYFSKSEISFLLNLPENSSSDDIKSKLTSLLTPNQPKRTFSDADQTSITSDELDYLKKQLEKERTEKQNLITQVQIQKGEIEKLKEQINDSEHQVQLLQAQISIEKDDDSTSSMYVQYKTTVDDLTKQLDANQRDITTYKEENANLKTLVDKQKREIESLKEKAAEATTHQSDDELFTENIFERNNDDLFDRISEQTILISSPFVDDITDIIQDSDKSDEDKVVDIVSSLIQDIRQKQETINSLSVQTKSDTSATNKNLFEKVVSAMNNQLAFLSRLADCENDLSFMKSPSDTLSHIRNVVQSEVKRASEFIKENCAGVIEDAFIQTDFFDSLAFDEDPTKFEQEMELYLKTYPEPSNEESQSLMLLLRHLLAALAICIRFATQAKSHTSRLAVELQKSKYIINDYELKVADQTNEIESQKEFLNNIMNHLKSAVQYQMENMHEDDQAENEEEEEEYEDENRLQQTPNYQVKANSKYYSLSEMFEAIKQFEPIDDVDNEEYTQSLEYRYSELLVRLSKYDRMKQTIKTLRKRIRNLEKQMQPLRNKVLNFENTQNEIKQLKAENGSLLESLNGYKSNYSQPKQSMEKESQTEIIQVQEKAESVQRPTDEQYQSIESKYLKYKEKSKGYKSKLKKSLLENQTLINQVSEKDRQIMILESTQQDLLVDQKNRTKLLRDTELQSQKTIQQLNKQLKEAGDRLAATELSKLVIEQQLRSLKEKEKRDEIDMKSIRDLYQDEFESKLNDKLKQCRTECNNKHAAIMNEIIKNFKAVFDITSNSPGKSKPSDEKLNDLVIKLSQLAVESVKQATFESKKLKRNLKELQTLFNAATFNELSRTATAFVNDSNKEIESLRKQVERLSFRRDNSNDSQMTSQNINGKMMTTRDWENWARKLYMWSNNGQTLLLSLSAIMRGVEEAILEANGTNKLSKLLEILKTEKVIMINKQKELNIAFSQQKGNRVVSIKPIIHVFGLIRKLQRLSGTLPSTLSFATPNAKTFIESTIVESDEISFMNNSPDFVVNKTNFGHQTPQIEEEEEDKNSDNFLQQALNFDVEEEEEDGYDDKSKETAVEVVEAKEEVEIIVQDQE